MFGGRSLLCFAWNLLVGWTLWRRYMARRERLVLKSRCTHISKRHDCRRQISNGQFIVLFQIAKWELHSQTSLGKGALPSSFPGPGTPWGLSVALGKAASSAQQFHLWSKASIYLEIKTSLFRDFIDSEHNFWNVSLEMVDNPTIPPDKPLRAHRHLGLCLLSSF